MDTSAAFLEAICLEPDDDGLRLIYADWLEDHDQPGRAEFIRVQCELERRWPGNPTWPIHGQRRPLRRRERELFTWDNIEAWFGHALWQRTTTDSVEFDRLRDTVNATGITAALVRRGFVEAVTLTCAAFAGGPCGRCGGGGIIGWQGQGQPRTADRCPACHGTGTTEGVAGALFRAAPVREVRLSDKQPDLYQPRAADLNWSWYLGGGDHATLPKALFGLLPGGWPALRGQRVVYPAERAARDALSAACVALGRRAAGLPALTPAPAAAP